MSMRGKKTVTQCGGRCTCSKRCSPSLCHPWSWLPGLLLTTPRHSSTAPLPSTWSRKPRSGNSAQRVGCENGTLLPHASLRSPPRSIFRSYLPWRRLHTSLKRKGDSRSTLRDTARRHGGKREREKERDSETELGMGGGREER